RAAASTSDGAFWTNPAGHLLRVSMAGDSRRWRDDDDPVDVSDLRVGADGHLWIDASNGVYTIGDSGAPRRVVAEAQDQIAATSYRSWHAPDGALWVSHGGHLWDLGRHPHTASIHRPPDLVS